MLVLGEAEAFHSGVDVERLKRISIVLVSAMTGVAVSVCGVVGFVGIVVPHLLRLVIGPAHRLLLPASMLLGAMLLVGADTLARTIVAPAEMPIGILTAAIGAPFFLACCCASAGWSRYDRHSRSAIDLDDDRRRHAGRRRRLCASRPARWSRSSARTAPASRRCCGMLSGDLRPTRGAVGLKQRELAQLCAARTRACTARCCRSMSTSPSRSRSRKSSIWARATRGRAAAQRLVDAALDEVDLARFSDRQLPTLSGGEQQRAHFARVLVQLACGEAAHGPGLLLLDEPTSSLDLRHQIDLVETARRRAQNGTAVIAVLHDLNLAMRFADRIVLLHRGRLAVDGGRTDAITAETIRRIFEVDVTIDYTDQGVPFLLPQTMRPAGPPTA